MQLSLSISILKAALIPLTRPSKSYIVSLYAKYYIPMCEFFSSYTLCDCGFVGTIEMGNEGVCKIVGLRDASIETNIVYKLKWKK